MEAVKLETVKKDDFVEFEIKALPGFGLPSVKTLKGLIHNIRPGYETQDEKREKVSWVEVLTEKGIMGTYLKVTDDVMKHVLSEEERTLLVVRNKIRNLRRVVDTQGSDPEIFVVNKRNEVIPSYLFLKGKDSPNRIEQNNQPLFWDGFQAEFNLRAESCLDATLIQVWYGLKALDTEAKKFDKDARLTIMPTMDVDPQQLREGKEEHVQFGCMPSKNVYGMTGKKEDGRDVPFRSAGGHIHIGLRWDQKKKIEEYVKALDAILGVACVSMFGQYDEPRRREYYGLAGEYRTPAHGMEYRPLSNVWMCHPTATYIIFELARKVITLVDEGLFKHWQYDEKTVIDCINTCNIPLACEILRQNEQMFKDLIASFAYRDDEKTEVIYNSFLFGIEELISNPDDVYGNWDLHRDGPRTSDSRIMYMKDRFTTRFKKLLGIKI